MNLGKSDTVVFNATPSQVAASPLRYNGAPMRTADSYKYLGLRLARRNHIRACLTALENAGRFAAVSTLQRCFELHIDEPSLACRLFDCQVLPCLSYAAELWLPYLPDPWLDLDKHMATPLEKTHVRFLRSITRVGAKPASITLFAECNRAPIYLHCLKQACRFWNKLCDLDYTHVSRDVFIESAALAAAGKDTWVARMVTLMQG